MKTKRKLNLNVQNNMKHLEKEASSAIEWGGVGKEFRAGWDCGLSSTTWSRALALKAQVGFVSGLCPERMLISSSASQKGSSVIPLAGRGV